LAELIEVGFQCVCLASFLLFTKSKIMNEINEKAIIKAPDSQISKWIKQTEELMLGFKELPEGENKKAVTTAINTISRNLNELRLKEIDIPKLEINQTK